MDDSSGPLGALIFFVLFIIINGVLYGFGSAVQKVSESDIEKRAEEEGDKKSLWLLKAMNHPVPIVNTILTTATLLSILTGYIGIRGISPYVYARLQTGGGTYRAGYPSRVIMIVSVIIVVIFALILLVSLGVVSAKKIFSSNPDRWVYRTAGIVRFFVGLFSPLTFVIMKLSNGVVRLFGVDPHSP